MNSDLLRLAAVLGLLALLLGLQWRFGFRHDMRVRPMLDNLVVALAGSGLLPLIGNKAHAPRGYVQAPPLATPPPPRSTWQHHTSQAQPARPPTM